MDQEGESHNKNCYDKLEGQDPPKEESTPENKENSTNLSENSEKSVFKVPDLIQNNLPKFKGNPQTITDNKLSGYTTETINTEGQNSLIDKTLNLSPAELLQQSKTPIPYKEPSWGGPSKEKFSFEVLKNGVIIDNIDLTKSFYVFGRLQSCDITLEHPSLSRYHAVVQFCASKTDSHDIGWYLYDLDSTHGTWINKHKVYAKKYYRIHVGHVLKFGGSTRLFILQGPDEDREEESEMSVTEMKEQREKQKKEAEVLRLADLAAQEQKMDAFRKKEEESGCSWGMADDAMDDENTNPFSEEIKLENEELYITDPKKALKGFYEREGYEEPEYIVTDAGSGKYKCAVELPVDGPNGEPVIAEAVVSGKKKEAVLQCALEGCRILDRMNLLRASTHESRKRKQKNWEDDDFYDSDEDSYLDRTGDIEKKRQQRMRKAGKMEGKTETYQTLVEKHEVITNDIQEIEAKLEKAKSDAAAVENDDLDALDAYMMAIKSGVMDTKTKMALKRQLMELKQEEMKIRRLVNIAKPATLPELKSPQVTNKSSSQLTQNKLPMIGKIKTTKAQKRPLVPSRPAADKNVKEYEEEEEEEDEDDIVKTEGNTQEDPTSRLKGDQLTEKISSQPSTPSKSHHNDKDKHEPMEISQDNIPKNDTQTIDKQSLESSKSKKNSSQQHKDKEKKKQLIKSEGKISGNYDSTDPDYAVWMPPTGQTGDGKTSLNEKFGY